MTAPRSVLNGLLQAYWDSQEHGRRELLERVWTELGGRGAVLITDMSRFSRITRELGIVHYLAMIRCMQRTVSPLVESREGMVVKLMADNCFSLFTDVPQALEAAMAMVGAVGAVSTSRPEDPPLEVCSGLDWGRLLLVCSEDEDRRVCDYFGDPVNVASKLGEDLAGPGEVLITGRAMERVPADAVPKCRERRFRISGLEIDALSVRPASKTAFACKPRGPMRRSE